jgi:hypothetical protein
VQVLVVQELLSWHWLLLLQLLPQFGIGALVQAAVAALHESKVQALLSLQVLVAPATQTPLVQASTPLVPVQALPSLHCVPLVTGG